jgi:poly(hydroxyalkanoate) granule-associated protein
VKIRESANQIWLAGLGAFSKAQQEGTKMFETLVEEGEKVQERTKVAVDERLGEMRGAWDKLSWDKLEKGAQSSWRRTLSAIVAAGGCALFAAMAVVPDAQAQIQASESRQLQGDPRVPLQSLHPIVEQVLPAVVNVSVAIKEAEEGELVPAANSSDR